MSLYPWLTSSDAPLQLISGRLRLACCSPGTRRTVPRQSAPLQCCSNELSGRATGADRHECWAGSSPYRCGVGVASGPRCLSRRHVMMAVDNNGTMNMAFQPPERPARAFLGIRLRFASVEIQLLFTVAFVRKLSTDPLVHILIRGDLL